MRPIEPKRPAAGNDNRLSAALREQGFEVSDTEAERVAHALSGIERDLTKLDELPTSGLIPAPHFKSDGIDDENR